MKRLEYLEKRVAELEQRTFGSMAVGTLLDSVNFGTVKIMEEQIAKARRNLGAPEIQDLIERLTIRPGDLHGTWRDTMKEAAEVLERIQREGVPGWVQVHGGDTIHTRSAEDYRNAEGDFDGYISWK